MSEGRGTSVVRQIRKETTGSGPTAIVKTTVTETTTGPDGEKSVKTTVTTSSVGSATSSMEALDMDKNFHFEINKDGLERRTRSYLRGWSNPAGEGKPPPRVARIISQDYEVIKRECLAQGALWEDPCFPEADSKSHLQYEWKRPRDLVKDPRMFVDGFSRFDIRQGSLGNCWLIAATASLCATRDMNLFHRVIPLDNLFEENYAGVFHFKIWQYGNWIDVVVDDRLPTLNDQLVFVSSHTQNEFWPALLEKAYAKVNGSYEALNAGTLSEAMEDFTGGLAETFYFQNGVRSDMFVIMKKAFERHSLMGCSVASNTTTAIRCKEETLPTGLVAGHAYSITAVKQCRVRGQIVNLVRIRNPWGNEAEWNGAWSDGSPEWEDVTEEEKKGLLTSEKDRFTFEKDGEFWMSFEDFIANFTKLEICMTTQEYQRISTLMTPEIQQRRTWKQTSHVGSWKRNVNAGGCINNISTTFGINPQYRVQVVDPDEDDDDNTGTIVIALMQKERRRMKHMLSLGYIIYKIDANSSGPLDANFFVHNSSIDDSGEFINAREVVGRHKLTPGTYMIIPSTFKANEEGDFLLRIFSEHSAMLDEMDEDTEFIESTQVKKTHQVTQTDVEEEREFKELFKITAGEDLEVDAYELRGIFRSKFKTDCVLEDISLETSRSMIAMMDIDRSGKLGYDEFKTLLTDLRRWKKIFKEYDKNNNSTLDSFELRAALNSAGFRVSNQTFRCLVMRYSDPQGQLLLNDFILCAVRLKTMFEIFRSVAQDENAQGRFYLDEFIQATMYS